MDDYNYSVFDMQREEPVFEAFPTKLNAGSRAPSFPLQDLATGNTIDLRSLWKGEQVAVLEFGSFT
jgi:hypothetical protein